MNKINISNISKQFNETYALKDINLSLKKGECLSIVGPSGSGKSTLLRIIAGLTEPTSGTLFIDEVDKTHARPGERNLTFVFQNLALYPHLTAKENIEFSVKSKVAKEELETRTSSIARNLNIAHLLDRYPNELSGGEKQRVALARSLATQADIILMDEPLASLDTSLKREITDLILNIKEKEKKTILYVTHDHNEAMKLSDQILVLKNGVVQQCDTTNQIYHEPSNPFVAKFFGNHPMNVFTLNDQTVGVRVEDIVIAKDGYTVNVTHVEHIGSDYLVQFNFNGELLTLLTRNNKIHVGDEITIEFLNVHNFKEEKLHVNH